jgi:hypothetical protein
MELDDDTGTFLREGIAAGSAVATNSYLTYERNFNVSPDAISAF